MNIECIKFQFLISESVAIRIGLAYFDIFSLVWTIAYHIAVP